MTTNIIMLLVTGALVNGPYALITTAVSAQLGTHPSVSSWILTGGQVIVEGRDRLRHWCPVFEISTPDDACSESESERRSPRTPMSGI